MIVLTFPACSSSFRTYSFVCFVLCAGMRYFDAITASSHTCSSLSTPKWPLRFQPTSPRPARASSALSSSLAGLQLLQNKQQGSRSRCWMLWGLKLQDEWEEAQRRLKTRPRDGNKRQVNSRTVRVTGQWVHGIQPVCVYVFSQMSLCKSCIKAARMQLCGEWQEFWFEVNLFCLLCTWGCETFQSRLTFIMKDEITISNPFLPFIVFMVVKLECLLCGSDMAAKTLQQYLSTNQKTVWAGEGDMGVDMSRTTNILR